MNNQKDKENCWLCSLALHHDDKSLYIRDSRLGAPVASFEVPQSSAANRVAAGEIAWALANNAGFPRGKDRQGYYYGFTINLPGQYQNKSNERRKITTLGK
jgi:hypothetical protein